MNLQLPPISAVCPFTPIMPHRQDNRAAGGECDMFVLEALIVVIILGVIGLALSTRTVKQYERGLVFRFGRSGKTSAALASR